MKIDSLSSFEDPGTVTRHSLDTPVIRLDHFGFSISIDCLNKDFKQVNRRLISHSFEAQASSSSVIDDAKDVARFLGRVCDTCEIHCPYQILGNRFWNAAFPLMAEVYDFGRMVTQYACDIGFSDGDSLFGSEVPVKDVGYCAAAGFVGMGFDANDFSTYPCWFGHAGTDRLRWFSSVNGWMLCVAQDND